MSAIVYFGLHMSRTEHTEHTETYGNYSLVPVVIINPRHRGVITPTTFSFILYTSSFYHGYNRQNRQYAPWSGSVGGAGK